jgi:hypothetical protein
MEQKQINYGCNHKWKVIRAEEGQKETLMTYFGVRSGDVMIYHLQCEKCGTITERIMDICHRGFPFKLLKETKI